MSVSAIIVTRGDVDILPILDSIPDDWEKLVWDNGAGTVRTWKGHRWGVVAHPVSDVSVYGRYAAIEHAGHDLIYVQDDDVIVSDPGRIVAAWEDARAKCEGTEWDPRYLWHASPEDIKGIGFGQHVACNMPPEFRHDFYEQHALVGFGAVFQRDTPKRAFDRWYAGAKDPSANGEWGKIRRTCDIIVTALSPRILVDVPKTNLSYAENENRMYRQPEHQSERTWMLAQTMKVKEEAQ